MKFSIWETHYNHNSDSYDGWKLNLPHTDYRWHAEAPMSMECGFDCNVQPELTAEERRLAKRVPSASTMLKTLRARSQEGIDLLIAKDNSTALIRALGAFDALRISGMTTHLLYESACRISSSSERAILRIALAFYCGDRVSSNSFLSDFVLLERSLRNVVMAVLRRIPG